jgi:hypothetical protein
MALLAAGCAGPSRAAVPQRLVIPVVVHVVLDEASLALVSPAIIFTQLDALNRDCDGTLDPDELRAIACDHGALDPCPALLLAAPPGLAFGLALEGPDGEPTSGITYTITSVEAWDLDDAASLQSTASGGCDPWPETRFLNLWVANLRSDPYSGESQGRAWPLGTTTHNGIAIDYRAFGDFGGGDFGGSDSARKDLPAHVTPAFGRERGRTATHEVGHWLGLLHPWGLRSGSCETDGDGIADTPPQAARNGYCTPLTDSCPGDAWMDLCQDFMDYAPDRQRVLFTHGQVERMRATLLQSGAALLAARTPVYGWDSAGHDD